jgi:hypothetical protein
VLERRETVQQLRTILRIARPALAQDTFRKPDRLLRDSDRELDRPRDSFVLLETLDVLLDHFRRCRPGMPCTAGTSSRWKTFCWSMTNSHWQPGSTSTSSISGSSTCRHHGSDAAEGNSRNLPVLLQGIAKTACRTEYGQQPRPAPAGKTGREPAVAADKRYPRSLKPYIAGLDRLGRLLGQDSDLAMPV